MHALQRSSSDRASPQADAPTMSSDAGTAAHAHPSQRRRPRRFIVDFIEDAYRGHRGVLDGVTQGDLAFDTSIAWGGRG